MALEAHGVRKGEFRPFGETSCYGGFVTCKIMSFLERCFVLGITHTESGETAPSVIRILRSHLTECLFQVFLGDPSWWLK